MFSAELGSASPGLGCGGRFRRLGGSRTLADVKLGFNAAVTEAGPGNIDYRLSRQHTLMQWRSGELSRLQVCDAQSELRRNAVHCGTATVERCPICEEHDLAHVTYVFGPRLPSHGRCVTSAAEHARLAQRKGEFTGYVVEVCAGCGWNHLVRSYLLSP